MKDRSKLFASEADDWIAEITPEIKAGSLTHRIRGYYLRNRGYRNTTTERSLRVLSDAELERLTLYLRHHRTRDNLGVLLCLTTGMKRGELCALRWEDLQLGTGAVAVCGTLQRVQSSADIPRGKKTAIEYFEYPEGSAAKRILPLSAEVLTALRDVPEMSGAYLLCGERAPWLDPRTFENRLKRTMKACGLENVGCNALRDTFAIRNLASGKGLEEVSRLLGHASVSVTEQRYGAWRKEQDPCGGEL